MSLKTRVHQILEMTEEGDRTAKLVMAFITVLIFASLIGVILESVASINDTYRDVLFAAEIIIVAAFTVEYALRLWSCTEDGRYAHPVFGRLRYAISFFALIDLFAILPFYLPLVVALDARFLRAVRLMRIFRMAKVARYSKSFELLLHVAKREKDVLIVTLAFIVILIVMASCVMWHVEYQVQPEKFASIPDTMWWAVATITTVGYGDVVPITPLGKLLGALIALLGVLTIALPAGIIVSGFIDEKDERREREHPQPVSTSRERIELLERLQRLRETDALTDEEYAEQKRALLR